MRTRLNCNKAEYEQLHSKQGLGISKVNTNVHNENGFVKKYNGTKLRGNRQNEVKQETLRESEAEIE